ncbi:hypothetical protein D9M71_496810 [compost metagenome]
MIFFFDRVAIVVFRLELARDGVLGVLELPLYVLVGAGFAWWQRRTGLDQAQGRLAQPRTVVRFGDGRYELAVHQRRVVRVVELQGFQAGGSQFVQVQALVGLGHHRQAVADRRGFLEVFHHVTTAVRGGDIGLTGQVVVGHVNFVGRQQVAQIDHALLGIRCVTAVREAAGQLGELVIGVAGGARVTLGHVQRQEARQQADVLVERSQTLEVVGIIDVRMLWVQTNEAFRSGLGRFWLGVLVVGVDEFELRLIGIATERITRFQSLQLGDGTGVATVVQVILSLLVQLDFTEVFVYDFLR